MTCPTLLYMFRYTASDETNVQHGNHLPSRHSHAQGNQTKFIQAPLCLCLYVSLSFFLSLKFSLFRLLIYRCKITTYLDTCTQSRKPNQTKPSSSKLHSVSAFAFVFLSFSLLFSLPISHTHHPPSRHSYAQRNQTKPKQTIQIETNKNPC